MQQFLSQHQIILGLLGTQIHDKARPVAVGYQYVRTVVVKNVKLLPRSAEGLSKRILSPGRTMGTGLGIDREQVEEGSTNRLRQREILGALGHLIVQAVVIGADSLRTGQIVPKRSRVPLKAQKHRLGSLLSLIDFPQMA